MNEWQRLEASRFCLSRQEYKTIKGQLRAGDVQGAMKGLNRLMEVRNHSRENERAKGQGEKQRNGQE